MAATATEMAPATSTAPRFLERLFEAETARVAVRRREREREHSLSSDVDVDAVPPPPLSYTSSSASATSSEPPSDLLVRENSWTYNGDPTESNYAYYCSSEDSRCTSPASKSMFSDSPALPLRYMSSSSTASYLPKWQQSPSSPFASSSSYSPMAAYIHNQAGSHYGGSGVMQPLTLPPPSLDLPVPSSSTSSPKIAPSLQSCLTLTASDSSTAVQPSFEEDPDEGDTDMLVASPRPLSPQLQYQSCDTEDILEPPGNFAMVYPQLYRSSFPSKKNYSFLRSLGLKTVLTLVQDEYSEENRAFFQQEGIALYQIGIPANKEPFVSIPDEKIRRALRLVLDKRNHPMLIHCNKGKHRTGCLVGCLRKMQCWSATAVFDEYRRFSFPKSRVMDQLFIELFQPVSLTLLPLLVSNTDSQCLASGLGNRRQGEST